MGMLARFGVITGILAITATATATAQSAERDTLPAGVTAEMVTRGKLVFTGPGVCFACHGMNAEGGTGPSLVDSVWIHNRGEYDKLVELILAGVSPKESKSGIVMPPRGGSAINDADLHAVAAYVWSLSRRRPSQ